MPVSAEQLIQWQTEMSNSAHQREVADLKAAGLNPVLSAKFGGASTPSGAVDSSGSGGGSGYGGGTLGSSGDGFLDGLIGSLPKSGSVRILGVNVPYSTIRYLYEQGKQALPDLTAALGAAFNTNFAQADVLNSLGTAASGEQNNSARTPENYRVDPDDPMLINGGTHSSAKYVFPSKQDVAAGHVANTELERILYDVNPRLLDMYWHLSGNDAKRRYVDAYSKRFAN